MSDDVEITARQHNADKLTDVLLSDAFPGFSQNDQVRTIHSAVSLVDGARTFEEPIETGRLAAALKAVAGNEALPAPIRNRAGVGAAFLNDPENVAAKSEFFLPKPPQA